MIFAFTWEGRGISENSRGGPWTKRRAGYSVFLNDLTVCLRAERVRKLWVMECGRVAVLLMISCPAGMDHHNLIKPCLDALQLAGIVENDREARDVRAVWIGSAKVTRIDFLLEALPQGATMKDLAVSFIDRK